MFTLVCYYILKIYTVTGKKNICNNSLKGSEIMMRTNTACIFYIQNYIYDMLSCVASSDITTIYKHTIALLNSATDNLKILGFKSSFHNDYLTNKVIYIAFYSVSMGYLETSMEFMSRFVNYGIFPMLLC